MEDEKQKQKQKQVSSSSSSYCCISHGFHGAASTNSGKIAVIHAGKRPENRDGYETNNSSIVYHLEKEPSSSSINHLNPPVHEGDQFFTFSDLLSAVDSLSFRLHRILNGGDDPFFLIRPISGNNSHKNLKVTTKILGVYMAPSVEYVIAVLSILRCGGAFLPLDPTWPKERILSIISSSNVDLVIGCLNSDQKSKTHLLNKSNWLLQCCNFPVLFISIGEILEQKCGELGLVWPCESRSSRLFSYLMYTSGSTGKPKGVCGTEEGLLNRFLWMQEFYPLKGDEILLFKTSVSFVDHLQEFLAPMLTGCTLVIPPFNELKENLFSFVDYLHDYSITRITTVPSMMRIFLPVLETLYSNGVHCSLKLLVLSGEVFPTSLYRILSSILPNTLILNIYGSTEVSGDCTYFDCTSLSEIPEYEMLSSVPIGVPISNCQVKLVEEDGKLDEGEICVKGVCLSSGYYSEGNIMPLDTISVDEQQSSGFYYKTGDFARRLPSGDLVFLGRKDRTMKINGQRIALEEVEDTLRGHPDIADVAVVCCNEQEGHAFLGAVLVLKKPGRFPEVLGSVKSWMVERLPSAMIPREIVCAEAIPMTSSGKVDYTLLSSTFRPLNCPNNGHIARTETLEHIKNAFHNALGVAEVGPDDDFFVLGGDSIIAAHVAHKLGIDMRLLYMFPSPSKLQMALMEKEGLFKIDHQMKWDSLPKGSRTSDFVRPRKHRKTTWTHTDDHGSSKRFKVDDGSIKLFPWDSYSVPIECALTRCNKIMYNSNYDDLDNLWPETQEVELPRDTKGSLHEIWRVPMDSCVDASPLVVFKHEKILLFIGSHSHKFLCVNAIDGLVQWEIKLEGRIECSSMVDGDFSQVVFGCYRGKIYFIDMLKGIINWTFQTGGEVKSQPTLDKCRHLIWCGSYDHNLYGLDYRNHCCVHQFPCGGSIFGSPVIDEVRDILYVGTTNGRLTAITLKSLVFSTMWMLELETPIFGSLSTSPKGHVICCLVNGDVLCVDPKGSIIWRVKTDGPIFAGPCISNSLGSQAIISSRNGIVYSFDSEKGSIMWEYDTGVPITSSAYVDDNIKLICDHSLPSERLVCICSSFGRIHLLRVSFVAGGDEDEGKPKDLVKKFAQLDLQGDIFSSPVMVGGRIFVGCRDDYLHCIVLKRMTGNVKKEKKGYPYCDH